MTGLAGWLAGWLPLSFFHPSLNESLSDGHTAAFAYQRSQRDPRNSSSSSSCSSPHRTTPRRRKKLADCVCVCVTDDGSTSDAHLNKKKKISAGQMVVVVVKDGPKPLQKNYLLLLKQIKN